MIPRNRFSQTPGFPFIPSPNQTSAQFPLNPTQRDANNALTAGDTFEPRTGQDGPRLSRRPAETISGHNKRQHLHLTPETRQQRVEEIEQRMLELSNLFLGRLAQLTPETQQRIEQQLENLSGQQPFTPDQQRDYANQLRERIGPLDPEMAEHMVNMSQLNFERLELRRPELGQ